MTQRAGRKIRSKTARMMLTFRHYEFKQRLQWKAWQRGALVLDVNEGVHQQYPQLGRHREHQVGRCQGNS